MVFVFGRGSGAMRRLWGCEYWELWELWEYWEGRAEQGRRPLGVGANGAD